MSHILPSGEDRPIAFASKTLNKPEINYAQIEREVLSTVFGVRKFHQYLFAGKFIQLTDHQPLTSIFGPHTGIPSLAASYWQPVTSSGGLCYCPPFIMSSSIDGQISTRTRAELYQLRSSTFTYRFTAGERVLARNYTGGVKWVPAIVVAKTGPLSYVQTGEQVICRRHVNQLLHTGSCNLTSFVPELEGYQGSHSSPEINQKQLSGRISDPATSTPAQVPAPGIPPNSELLQSLPGDSVVDILAGRMYPKRNRRPPDRLFIPL